jgi:hypothetical protein
MPSVNLDNQISFVENTQENSKAQRQKPNILCQDAQVSQSQLQIPQYTEDEAIIISSDDESDYDDVASIQSSSSLFSLDQLLVEGRECIKSTGSNHGGL